MKYIVAVSGGVDSVVLLDMLSRQPIEIVVAHVDHGIRKDSHEDEVFVRSLADEYGLPYMSTKLELGPRASEETARDARYAWLEEVQHAEAAAAIVTAHHQDDVLETMCINLIRGTGWRGLTSLRSTPERLRPLLDLSKAEIVAYALERGLAWREDSTNDSFRYLRNRVRSLVIPRLKPDKRRKLLELYRAQLELHQEITAEIEALSSQFIDDGALRRYETIMVDDIVIYELIRVWLGTPLEQKRLRELLLFLKVAKPGSRWSIDSERFVLSKTSALIVERPRD